MHPRNRLIMTLLALLVTACHGSADNSATQAAGSGRSRGGSGESTRVNFTELATSADGGAEAPILGRSPEAEPGLGPDLPSRAPSGTRKGAAQRLSLAPQAPSLPPCRAATSPCPFDGIAQASCPSCTVPPPDPNAAVGAGKIVEVVNELMQVNDRHGALQCKAAVTLQRLLRTTDSLTDPHVQFDNVNQRFIFVVTVNPASASSIPAMWVATSETDDPCGTWYTYRLTFHGDPYAKGRVLDFPTVGQDTHAILISSRTCDANFNNCDYFTVFGLPKSIVYTGAHVEFDAFEVDSLTAPVINAGQPMIESPVSFFLASVPGTGYKLYRLTHSGGTGASLSKTTIAAPFAVPTRNVAQPGTTATLNPSDGSITSSPYFDGTFIWFVHDGDDDGFPTVLYGKLDTSSNTVTTTWAFHSGSSDDFNPSLAVGMTASGETVYLNWVFTDSNVGTAATPVFASGDASKPLVAIAGPGTADATGGGVITPCGNKGCRFGDFSSVSLDPTVEGCAWATQEYFDTSGNWKSRVAPIGSCENVVIPGPH